MPKVERIVLVSQTYEIVTSESAENGEAEDRGFDFEDVPYTLRELVSLLKDGGFCHFSNSHYITSDVWVSSEAEQDYTDGSYETKSLHFSHKNTDPKAKRLWVYALESLKGSQIW